MPAKVQEYALMLHAIDRMSGPVRQAGESVTEFAKRIKEADGTAPKSFGGRLRAKFAQDRREGVNAFERFAQPEELTKEALERLTGGPIAAAGVYIAAETFGKLGEAVADYGREAATAGEHSQSLFGRLAEAIPVIGGIKKGIQGLRDGLGDYVAARALNGGDVSTFSALASAEAKQRLKERFEPVVDAEREIRQASKDAFSTLGKEGQGRELAQLDTEMDARMKKIGAARQQALKLPGPSATELAKRLYSQEESLDEEHQERIAEIEKRWGQGRQRVAFDAERRITDIVASARQTRLRITGDEFGAGLDAIASKAAADVVGVVQQVRERIQSDPRSAVTAVLQGFRTVGAIADATGAAAEQFGRDQGHDQQERTREAGLRLAEVVHDVRMANFRIAQQDFRSELEDLKDQHERRIEQMTHDSQEEARHASALAKLVIFARLGIAQGAERGRYNAAVDAATDAHNRELAERRLDVAQQLSQQNADYYRREAEFGDARAGRMARVLDMAQQYRQVEVSALAILKNHNATLGQRLQALLNIGATELQLRRRLARSNLPGYASPTAAEFDANYNVGGQFASQAPIQISAPDDLKPPTADEIGKAVADYVAKAFAGMIGVYGGASGN